MDKAWILRGSRHEALFFKASDQGDVRSQVVACLERLTLTTAPFLKSRPVSGPQESAD